MNAVEKYTVLEKGFEAVREKSYFHLIAVLFKKKGKTKERCKDENRKYASTSTLEESKAFVLVINGHGHHTT